MGKEQERMCIPVTKDGKPAYRIYLEESFEKLPDCLASLGAARPQSMYCDGQQCA